MKPEEPPLTIPAQTEPGRSRPITAARDHAQSIVLSIVVGTLVLYAAAFGVIAGGEQPAGGTVALVSLGFALLVSGMHASSPWGAFWGGLCCFTMAWWTRGSSAPLLRSLLPSLATLVAFTLVSTRLGRARKEAKGLAERAGGRRASQILANLGAATLFASPLGAYAAALTGSSLPIDSSVLVLAGVAALAEAAADTVSSEVGQAFAGKSRTYLITTMRRVQRGTDGGVSLVGSLSGVGAAIVVVTVATMSMSISWHRTLLALAGGLAGLIFDSLLGATLERKGWIGNDVVNFSSTIVAGLITLLLARIFAAA